MGSVVRSGKSHEASVVSLLPFPDFTGRPASKDKTSVQRVQTAPGSTYIYVLSDISIEPN